MKILHNSPLEVSINMILRYAPIVKKLKQLKKENPDLKVLEIGSGSKGVTRFFKHPVMGVDIEFQEHKSDLLTEVKIGREDKLPFREQTFDVVIAVDVLEHIPYHTRQKMLLEMRRVSKKHILMTHPVKWTEWDTRVLQTWPEQSATYQNIAEHRTYGLPGLWEIKSAFPTRYNYDIQTFDGQSAGLAYFIKLLERNLVGKIFARSALKILLPIFWLCKSDNRHVYFIEKGRAL